MAAESANEGGGRRRTRSANSIDPQRAAGIETDSPAGSGADPAPEPAWHRFEPPLVPEGGDLQAFIGRVVPGGTAVALEYLDRGVVNSNYRVEVKRPGAAGGTELCLLRLSRSDEGPLREGAVLELAADRLAIPVPRLLGSEPGDRPEPHRRSLFTWVSGQSLEEIAAGPPAWLDRAATDLAGELARLHAITFPAFGRLDSRLVVRGRRGGAPATSAADEVAERIAVRLENPAHGLSREAGARVREDCAGLLALCATGTAAPGPAASLVHGDLSPGNILVAPDTAGTLRLAGLVDWEMARAADPAADFASLRLEMEASRLRFAATAFAATVEEAYRAAAATSGWAGAGRHWEARVRANLLPLLLDARMVAVRRRSAARVEWVDRSLLAALELPAD